MAKKQEAKEPISLKEIADEMNEVMQYGMNEDGELVNPEEQIDTEQKEKPLLAEILKNAKSDLRPDDENSFSEDAWNWFIDNGVTPGVEDPDPVDEPEPAPKKGKDKAPAKNAKSAKAKDDDEEKKGVRKAMVPGGNEAKAIEIVKDGGTLEDCIKEFTKIYKGIGMDADYAQKRAKIYYGIACKQLGIENANASRKGNAEALAKYRAEKKAAKEAPAKGRGRQAEPEDDPQDAPEPPKGRGRGRR